MVIYRPNGTALTSIEVDDESYHFAEIMGRDDVTLYFSLPQFMEFPVGCYITYMAKTYTLYSVDKMHMEHTRSYDYTITFESEAAQLDLYILTLLSSTPNFNRDWWRGYDDGDFVFPLTGTSAEHLAILKACLDYKTGQTWTIGSTIADAVRTISYDTMTCLDALKQIAEAFNTEYRIENRTIYLGKVEFFTNTQDQITLSYGKGNGLRPGVEKIHDTGEKTIGKLFVQGGDRNIDPSKYGSSTLHMPLTGYTDPSTHQYVDTYWYYDGTTVSGSPFTGALKFRCPTGHYIELAEDNAPAAEGAIDLSEIYPSFNHFVSDAVEVNADENLWDLYSSEFTAGASTPTKINYDECLIENGEQLSIIFQDGRLAGRQFAVNWATKEDPENEGQLIAYMEIVPEKQDGYPMPDGTNGFYPVYGNHFRVFNCYLPDSYIEAAEIKMRNEALAYLWEHCKERFSIKGEVDPIWSASRWLNIGSHFVPGAYFRFVDPTWESDGVSIRITNVKTFLNKPHQPIVELASGVTRQGISTELKKIQSEAKVQTESSSYRSKAFTKRSFADAKETMEMLIKSGLDYFTDAINPITVQTMQMLVGEESLQFEFIVNRTTPTVIDPPFEFNSTSKKLEYTAWALQHMTLDITDIRSSTDSRPLSAYKIWDISSGESAVLDEPEKAYYLYAKCDALNDGTNHLTGQLIISETAIGMEDQVTKSGGTITGGYYHFLAAIVNAEREGNRSIARLYGFTEVLPGQITTEIIRGSSGTSWWNLSTNSVAFGDKFTYSPANGVRLKNAMTVSSDGNTVTEIGAWCGEFDYYKTYGQGDEVWWEDNNGIISTYRYIANVSANHIYPSNTSYWQVVAQGEIGRGISGSPVDRFWYQAETDGTNPPQTPSGGLDSDYWKTTRPTSGLSGKYIWKRSTYTYSDNTTSATYTSEYCANDGTDGDPGPWLNSRGEWSSTELYYGSTESCDVVHYTNGKWYMAKSAAGNIPVGTLPTNSSYWSAFETNFSNIATGLLFAEREYVNNLYVRDLETMGTPYNGSIRAVDNYLMMVDELNQPKLLITGDNLASLSSTSGTSDSWSSDYENASSGTVSVDAYVAQISISQTDNNVSLSSVTITISRGTGSGSTRAEEATMTAAYYIDSAAVSSISENFTFAIGETSKTFTLPRTNRRVKTTGNHQIYIKITASTPNSNNLSRAAYSAGTVEVTYPNEAVQIGANGFRAAFSPTSYASFTKESGTVNYTIRNGNYGIQVTSSGIKMTFNGSNWYTASRDGNGNLVLL